MADHVDAGLSLPWPADLGDVAGDVGVGVLTVPANADGGFSRRVPCGDRIDAHVVPLPGSHHPQVGRHG